MNYKLKAVSALVGGLFISSLFVPAAAAQTSTTTTVAALQAQIQALLAQIESLNAQVDALRSEAREVREEARGIRREVKDLRKITRHLRHGATGGDVEELQELLASDPDIYPEGLVTGYFGPLTERAVRKFQEKFGIESVGVVGPITRAKLNAVFDELGVGENDIIPRGLLKNRFLKSRLLHVDNATTTTGNAVELVTICHIPPGNPLAAHSITISTAALQAHLAHGDDDEPCEGDVEDEDEDENEDEDEDENGNGDEEEDTTAPAISGIQTTDISTTTAAVVWITDEAATGKVWYGTATPLALETALESSHDGFVGHHTAGLSGLTASTTYYYIVVSSDEAGNTATSSEQSFATL